MDNSKHECPHTNSQENIGFFIEKTDFCRESTVLLASLPKEQTFAPCPTAAPSDRAEIMDRELQECS